MGRARDDVLSLLEDRHGYEVHSVAHKGDRVEDMAYSSGQLTKLVRALEKLIARGTPPKAVLLSGGGNDVAGDELAMLLNHARSAIAGLSPEVVAGVIDQRIRVAYLTILGAIDAICQAQLGRSLPILDAARVRGGHREAGGGAGDDPVRGVQRTGWRRGAARRGESSQLTRRPCAARAARDRARAGGRPTSPAWGSR